MASRIAADIIAAGRLHALARAMSGTAAPRRHGYAPSTCHPRAECGTCGDVPFSHDGARVPVAIGAGRVRVYTVAWRDMCECGHDGYDGHDMRAVPPVCTVPGCMCGTMREVCADCGAMSDRACAYDAGTCLDCSAARDGHVMYGAAGAIVREHCPAHGSWKPPTDRWCMVSPERVNGR